MKVIPILLLTLLCLSFIVISPPSIRSLYALKNKVGRYGIVTIDSVKSKFWSFSIHIWRKEGEKIKDNPDHINTIAKQLRHTFKWNVDDLPQDVGPGTQWIAFKVLIFNWVNCNYYDFWPMLKEFLQSWKKNEIS